jgi:predicted AAA+ superfamily ATPase
MNEWYLLLSADIDWQRVLAYLRFLNDTLLIRLVSPLKLRLKRRAGYPKLCLCDHSLRASWLQEIIPIIPDELRRSAHLSDLAWFPERGAELEVDFVITVGEHRIPLEVKYRQHIDEHRDTLGLRAFIEKTVYHAPFGVLITLSDDVSIADPRIVALPLSSLLLVR